MADYSKILASLSPEKRKLLERKLAAGGAFSTFPVSYSQQRLWFLQQLEPESYLYHIPLVTRFVGVLNVPILEQTIQAVIQRHEVLRTGFIQVSGTPYQKIQNTMNFALPVLDLSAMPLEKRQERVREFASNEWRRVFDLTQAPLFRATLLKTREREHVLVIILHHIITDGWSNGILLREVAALYNAFVQNAPSPLPALEIQYAEYANWQRKFLSGDQFEAQLSYWKTQLAEAPAHLHLPTDRPRPAFQSNHGADYNFTMTVELSRRIRTFCSTEGVTLFMMMLAAFKMLLFRYSGQYRISVGTPIANRTKKQFESLIGFFVNTLVMHTDLTGNPSFRELVQRVKAVTLGAYAHQDMPFERLVEELRPDRDPSYTPLFQTMFVLQNKNTGSLSLPELEISAVELPKDTSVFDLTLGVHEMETQLGGSIEYNTDLFRESTIARMAEHLQRLLDQAMQFPNTPIDYISLLDDQEHRQVVFDWNDTEIEYEKDFCIHRLIEEQVQRTPESIAVVSAGEQRTYRQINARANQLAHFLIKKGVKPDQPVALSIDRSFDMIVGLLAVLKSGAAYLPLDPEYPSERIAFMLEDSGAQIVLTQKKWLTSLPVANQQLVSIDDDWQMIEKEPETNPSCAVNPQNLAYIIYTSGSTGKPKGVMVPHRAVVNHNFAAIEDYQLTSADRVLQFASINFDAAVEEIFPVLMCGASLVLRDSSPIQAISEILRLAESEKVTVLDFPTAYWHQIAHELSLRTVSLPKTIRLCLIGGEKASLERYALWQATEGARVRLVNTYGPTETTIVSTIFDAQAEQFDPAGSAVFPIGRPIRNVFNFILDRQLNPVAVGVPGELYIGGKGVTRGYLNRPDLTAGVFLPDPFSKHAGGLMYKTGDLVRYLENGAIEYLGRADFQIKIRGFRVELGEIEAMLHLHESIRECSVIVRQVTATENELIAYVAGDMPTEAEVRAFLKERLPTYMIPAHFCLMAALPKTAGGKVDRHALPSPDTFQTDVQKVSMAPRTPTEEALVQLFADLLRVKQVGVDDDFFELGGHSLIATQLVSRIRDALGVELPLRHLFFQPTVEHLAAVVDEIRSGTDGSSRPAILPAPPDLKEKPLSFAQQRMWFLDQLEPASSQYNIPDAVRIRGRLDAKILRVCLQSLVQRHEILRTAFTTIDGRPRLDVLAELDIDLPVIDLSELSPEEREQKLQHHILENATLGFDLSRAPLFRLRLIKLGEEEHVLSSTMHHSISDGWSFAVLVNDVAILYSRLLRGDSTPMPPPAIQYSDFAVWQRQWLQGKVLEKQLAFWKQQLEDAPVLALPTDRPRPSFMTTAGAHLSFSFSREVTKALNELSRRHGVTLFMTLLSAFQLFLHRYARQDSISVGTPVANRTSKELESLIGFFVNTLVLRTELAGNPSFIELLRRVKEVTLNAYAHQDLPFEKIVDALQPERDAGHTPLFQVMFLLQNIPSQQRSIEGLLFESLPIETRTSNFDLTLVMEEQEGRLLGGFEYNTDLFNESTIHRMIQHFTTLVENIVSAPQQAIERLPMMNSAESFQVMFEWNRTAVDYGAPAVIHELITLQAERTPQAVAVKFKNLTLTFAELETRSNQLAQRLARMGVLSDHVVGVCFNRSPEMITALLGVLKAGAAYLPLDPNYPSERMQFMIKDSGVRVLLTQEKLAAAFADLNLTTLRLDVDWPQISLEPTEQPAIDASPQNLAYIIYTSGSTGLPKGVLVTHEGVVNHNHFIRNEYAYTTNDKVLQFFSLNFDGAVEEIFPTLMSGATLVLSPHEKVSAVDELIELAQKEGLTILDLPTAYWHELAFELDHYSKQLPSTVRLVITGGEAASPERYAAWQRSAGGVQWLNTYGPTEGTIIATVYDPAADPQYDGRMMPIGRPLANVQVYILDGLLNPAPVGVPGELCIGGAGVARGYLNRPDLTAEKFIPDPFGQQGSRLYRTGDLARFLENGAIAFVGRVDDQVKIRGFRIELGEVESALRRFAGLREAVVITRRDSGQDFKLAAYYVTENHEAIAAGDLRAFLKQQLPDYMVPHAFVQLDALPRMISGKIDRKSLPKPDFAESNGPISDEPMTVTEEKLAAIFKEILGLERVGKHDNFFERGGDSIMSIQIIAIAGQAGIRLTPKQLFEAPTPAGLAVLAGKGFEIAAEQGLVTGDTPLTPIQTWFFEQQFADADQWNQSLLFQADHSLNVDALQRALTRIVEHHDALRLRFPKEASNRGVFVEPSEHPTLIVHDLSGVDPAQQPRRIEFECARLQTGLSMEHGPLFIAAYFELGNSARLFIAAHHLVVDGVSWRILLEDIQTAYQQAAAGQEIQLPQKSTSYQYWAKKLDEYSRSAVVHDELAYWMHYERQLATRLPVDFPENRAENYESVAESVGVELSAEQTTTLFQQVLQAQQVQINDVLLAALVHALAAWSGGRSFLVEMEGHGREPLFEEVSLARTVGWFTTIFPVLLKSERGFSAKQTIQSIKALSARMPHHGIGYGLVRYAADSSELREKMAALPEAEIGFNYLGQFDQLVKQESPLRPANEAKGAERSPNAKRSHLLEVTAIVTGGQLRVGWEYSRKIHRVETVERLAMEFRTALESILQNDEAPATASESKTDFTLAKLDKRQLTKVLGQLNKGKGKSSK